VIAPSEIFRDADTVRREIAMDLESASSALIEFSRRYARTPEQKNAALAIKASVPNILDQAVAGGLQREMMAILDGILAEREHDDPSVSERLKARERLFVQFRRESARQETVCMVDQLFKQFGLNGFAVGPVSFEFRAGEITALIGEKAHGKTTFIRTLVGEHRANSGIITFPALSAGTRFHWSEVKQYIGYLPQKLPDWPGSLEDNLYFQAALHGLTPSESETQVRYLVARLDLSGHFNKRWSELSGGYQLRFALAKALAGRPRFLVLDEPLANLDLKAQAALLWDIRNLAKSARDPMAVLISTQVLNPLEAISDNLMFLRNGQTEYQGPTGGIGLRRTYNLYECETAVTLSTLRDRIGSYVEDIDHNGVYYIIRTSLSVTFSDFLQILKEADIEFMHCRDIGRKAAGLFERR
jgi:ABC-2 type transport system ATP-binding protein